MGLSAHVPVQTPNAASFLDDKEMLLSQLLASYLAVLCHSVTFIYCYDFVCVVARQACRVTDHQ